MQIDNETGDHRHCFHPYKGPMLIVLQPGQTFEKCCRCDATAVFGPAQRVHQCNVTNIESPLHLSTFATTKTAR